MLNTAFIQSNLPNLQTQEQLLKDRFEAKGYNFELVPVLNRDSRIKFSNRFDLEDKEYTIQELNDICFALTDGLVDGIIRQAELRNTKSGKLSYSMESLPTPFGAEIPQSLGYILYVPFYKSFDYIAQEEKTIFPYLVSIILVTFDK